MQHIADGHGSTSVAHCLTTYCGRHQLLCGSASGTTISSIGCASSSTLDRFHTELLITHRCLRWQPRRPGYAPPAKTPTTSLGLVISRWLLRTSRPPGAGAPVRVLPLPRGSIQGHQGTAESSGGGMAAKAEWSTCCSGNMPTPRSAFAPPAAQWTYMCSCTNMCLAMAHIGFRHRKWHK